MRKTRGTIAYVNTRISTKTFKDIIDELLAVVPNEDVNQALVGVQVGQQEGCWTFTATDRRVLCTIQSGPGPDETPRAGTVNEVLHLATSPQREGLVSLEDLLALKQALKKVAASDPDSKTTLSWSGKNQLQVSMPGEKVKVTVWQGEYPDWRGLLDRQIHGCNVASVPSSAITTLAGSKVDPQATWSWAFVSDGYPLVATCETSSTDSTVRRTYLIAQSSS